MKRIMQVVLLAFVVVVGPAMVCSTQGAEHTIIRDGYTVPVGQMLLIDDITIQCSVALTQPGPVGRIKVPSVGGMLTITTPVAGCREGLVDGACPEQFHSIGTGASEETLPGFGGKDGEYWSIESIVGRRTSIVAHGGDTLSGFCIWRYDPAKSNSSDIFLSGRILTGMGRLMGIAP